MNDTAEVCGNGLASFLPWDGGCSHKHLLLGHKTCGLFALPVCPLHLLGLLEAPLKAPEELRGEPKVVRGIITCESSSENRPDTCLSVTLPIMAAVT